LRLEALTVAVLVAGSPGWTAAADVSSDAEPANLSFSRDQVQAAAARLRADPNLGGTERIKRLSWNQAKAERAPTPVPAWLEGLFEFLSRSSAALIWAGGAVAAAIALVWSARVLTARVPAAATPRPVAATRIHGMDLAPESLPADIGAAALALFEAGRSREALSLMYRGALSRAVHRHGVSIEASYTEKEVQKAVNAALDAPRAAYIGEIIATWQRVVYAGEAVLHEKIARLCRTFVTTLDGAAA
jgi:hypothetical protein